MICIYIYIHMDACLVAELIHVLTEALLRGLRHLRWKLGMHEISLRSITLSTIFINVLLLRVLVVCVCVSVLK